jgi:hypothetical protein
MEIVLMVGELLETAGADHEGVLGREEDGVS